jgi:hypothetical protein
MNLFISNWVLLVAGLLFALPMLHLRIKNHTTMEEETVARMDDSGAMRDAAEVEKDMEKYNRLTTTA